MNERGEGPDVSQEKRQKAEQKLFGLLFVLGAAALFFGIFQTINAIRGPFQGVKQTNSESLGETGSAISALSKKDTDNDGLSDFDELYSYQTSPYLADSDSDGRTDQDEVFGGTDPNCAQGKSCSPLESIPISETNANTNGTGLNTNQPIVLNTNAGQQLENGISIADLREALKNAGAPAATINGLSDSDLLALYQEIAGSSAVPLSNSANTSAQDSNAASSENGNTNQRIPNANGSVDQTTLENFTPAQIREFLKAGGADESLLNQVDDETLRSIFQESLNELSTNS